MEYFKKKYRDIAMRAICDFHANNKEMNMIAPEYLYYFGIPKNINATNLVKVLQSMGLITYKWSAQDGIYSIDLTDTGRCYFERQHDLSRKEKIEWIRYAITTAIALAAFIKSFFF